MSNKWKSSISKLDLIVKSLKIKTPATKIDFTVNFLHYRVTAVALIGLSSVLTINQFWGEVIRCTSDTAKNKDLDEMANWYCLIHSTYTVPKSNPAGSAHPGVAPAYTIDDGDIVQHRYYLWVPVYLFVLGLFFYVPRYFWKSFEQGTIQVLTLNCKHPRDTDPVTKADFSNVNHVAKYFEGSRGYWGYYFGEFVLAEVYYLMNVIGQLVVLDKFFNNTLSTWGLQVVGFIDQDPEIRVDAIEAIFPKVTKCNFDKYGPSGSIVNHDYICLLPRNVMNEKVFIWIWFWLVLLSGITMCSGITWILFGSCAKYRLQLVLPHSTHSLVRQLVSENCTVSDTFFLYLIKRNVRSRLYERFLIEICKSMVVYEDELKLLRKLGEKCENENPTFFDFDIFLPAQAPHSRQQVEISIECSPSSC